MKELYKQQHRHRLNWMPWLYFNPKVRHFGWAREWQDKHQEHLQQVEDIRIGEDCFIADDVALFAEPNRTISIASKSFIASGVYMHGPVKVGSHVAINHLCSMDGGRSGIEIGDHTRIANHCRIYAFDHGMHPDMFIHEQPTVSKGIRIGRDCWIGANVCITDGVTIGDYAVVGMGSVVTRDVEPYCIVAGNPARPIGDRREKK